MAGSYTWTISTTAPATGAWSSAANWGPTGGPPGAGDTALLAGPQTAQAFDDISGPGNAASLTTQGNVILSGSFAIGDMTEDGSLWLPGNATLVASGDVLIGNGGSLADSDANVAVAGTITVEGGGELLGYGSISAAAIQNDGTIDGFRFGNTPFGLFSVLDPGVTQIDVPAEFGFALSNVVNFDTILDSNLTNSTNNGQIIGFGGGQFPAEQSGPIIIVASTITNSTNNGTISTAVVTDSLNNGTIIDSSIANVTNDGTIIDGIVGSIVNNGLLEVQDSLTLLSGVSGAVSFLNTDGPILQPGTLVVSGSTPAVVISDFALGDEIIVNAVGTSAVYTATGTDIGTLTLSEDGTIVATMTLAGDYTDQSFTSTPYAIGIGPPDASIVTLGPIVILDPVTTPPILGPLLPLPAACFAAGTRILTRRGEVPVEALRIGDEVATLLPEGFRPVQWLGYRAVNLAAHPKPNSVLPVRVRADAFGRGMPRRDLILSPDHAVFADKVLIPIKHLINGTSISQIPAAHVTYWHVELDAHDVLLAEGLPAESYLDTGARRSFSNCGDRVVTLHPRFSALAWEALGCAPLVVTGPVVAALHRRLQDRAARLRRKAPRRPARAA